EIVDTHEDIIPILGVKKDPSFVVMARSDSYAKLDLREILRKGLKQIKGRGGGIENLVQAGGIKPEDLASIITTLERLVQQKI
ncbi:MAG: DHH family phosphoesterase, partial [Candidatus Heimdallarchaeota archaeon]